jgi:hypothetical protein
MSQHTLFRRTSGALAVLTFLAGAGAARADVITLKAADSGWYTQEGIHAAGNEDYRAGRWGVNTYHDYFVFTLPDLSSYAIQSIQLRLTNPRNGFTSGNASETFTVFDVSTSIPILMESHFEAPLPDVFKDLGSGTSFGSRSLSQADNDTLVAIDLTSAELAKILQDSSGKAFALGGSLSVADAGNSHAFVGTDGTSTRELVIEVIPLGVPEPATLVLAVSGCVGLLGFGWRRRQAAV